MGGDVFWACVGGGRGVWRGRGFGVGIRRDIQGVLYSRIRLVVSENVAYHDLAVMVRNARWKASKGYCW